MERVGLIEVTNCSNNINCILDAFNIVHKLSNMRDRLKLTLQNFERVSKERKSPQGIYFL